MNVHPHFTDLAIFGLAYHDAPDVHPFTSAAAAECAAVFSGEPGARAENLSGLEGHLGLVLGQVAPVGADGGMTGLLGGEGAVLKHGVGREHRRDGVGVALLPALAERLDQRSKGVAHAANIPEKSGTPR